MRNYLLDVKSNFGEVKCTLKDENDKQHHFTLKRIKSNGCIFSTEMDGVIQDSVVFTMLDLKALFCLLTIRE